MCRPDREKVGRGGGTRVSVLVLKSLAVCLLLIELKVFVLEL